MLRHRAEPRTHAGTGGRAATRSVVASLAVGALLLTGCANLMSPPAPETLEIVTGAQPGLDAVALPGERDELVASALEQLPALAADALERSGVPGLAIAVVYEDEVVFAEGFGVREAGTDLKVDPDTVFQVASVSKSLSATAVAAAVSEGDVTWDTPIHDHLPEFAFSDPIVTGLATIGDAFSHRTGLYTGAGDDLEDLGFDRDTILDRLRLQPLDAFRSSYNYSNFGLTVGAEAVATARGQEWAELMQQLVFEPIGMISSSARHDDFLARDDRALLHAYIDGEFVAAYDRDPDPEAPAGGVSSTVNDLAQWMRVLLAGGSLGGEQIVDQAALVEAMSPQIVTSHAATGAERPSHYGHGFNANPQVSGRMSVSHSGAFVLGAATNFQVVPELELGIVALSNGAPVGMPEAVTASFLDLVQYGQVTRDWIADYGAAFAAYTEPLGDLVGVDRPADPVAAPSDEQIVGTYTSPYFGTATVQREGDELTVRLGPDGGIALMLDEWSGATFAYAPSSESAPWGSLASAVFGFGAGGSDADSGSGGEAATTLALTSFDERGLGTFTRKAG